MSNDQTKPVDGERMIRSMGSCCSGENLSPTRRGRYVAALPFDLRGDQCQHFGPIRRPVASFGNFIDPLR
jgi:hypothetical protein